MHVVCPHCHATNRLPAERLHERPDCGRCHQTLFNGSPTNVNAADFDRHLKHSDIPLLVDFWAAWCGPCLTMAPAFEQAAAELEPHFRLLKIDTEQEQALGTTYQVRSIPTLMLFRAGREVMRQAGAMSAADIVRWARMTGQA